MGSKNAPEATAHGEVEKKAGEEKAVEENAADVVEEKAE